MLRESWSLDARTTTIIAAGAAAVCGAAPAAARPAPGTRSAIGTTSEVTTWKSTVICHNLFLLNLSNVSIIDIIL